MRGKEVPELFILAPVPQTQHLPPPASLSLRENPEKTWRTHNLSTTRQWTPARALRWAGATAFLAVLTTCKFASWVLSLSAACSTSTRWGTRYHASPRRVMSPCGLSVSFTSRPPPSLSFLADHLPAPWCLVSKNGGKIQRNKAKQMACRCRVELQVFLLLPNSPAPECCVHCLCFKARDLLRMAGRRGPFAAD